MKAYLLSLLAMLLCMCQLSVALANNEAAPSAVNPGHKTQIIENIKAMWSAVEKGDLEAYLEYIHEDYSVFGESDAYLHEGKNKERIDYADFLSRAKDVRTFMHQPKVTINGNTAWISYYWNDAGYISGERYTSRGKSTRVFVLENGKWLCIHSHFTAVP